ncbi:MAG: DUF805 domain-containing protein [Clostridia bacterium]|nr:DUF805 domain-containing protein [Clostridia bacterium]
MSFFEAVAVCFRKYAEFSGRARRREYWYFVLFNSIVAGVLNILLGDENVVAAAYSLITLVPGIAVCWRRLHDIGKSGAWWLLHFVPLVGWIFLLVWYCRDSEPGFNDYGPSPKG